MTIQCTRLRGGRCATEFEDLRGNLERNRRDNLLGLIHLRIQRIDSCCCRRLPLGIRSKMFGEYRRDRTEDCINAGRLGVEFPYQLQHLWVIGDDVGCSMAEGSSTGLHILGSVSDHRFGNTDQRSQMHCLPGSLSICRPLPGLKAVTCWEYVVVIDCYVTEPCGSRGSESLPETVPVVHNFNPGRICRDQQRNGLFVVSDRCNGYPVSVACTG